MVAHHVDGGTIAVIEKDGCLSHVVQPKKCQKLFQEGAGGEYANLSDVPHITNSTSGCNTLAKQILHPLVFSLIGGMLI